MSKPFERYREYIKKLEREGKSLPVNQFNDINFKQVADAANMRRQWFSENSNKVFGFEGKTLDQIVREDFKALGSGSSSNQKINEKIKKDSESNLKENSKLRKMLNIKLTEIEKIKDENKHLQAEIAILRAKYNEQSEQSSLLNDTGRNFLWSK